MNTPHHQLPLQIGLKDSARFSNFYPGANVALVHLLESGTEPFVYISGAQGCGRSHLLQAACHAMDEQGESAVYLPLSECMSMSAQMLEGMEQMSLVALDDVELLAANAEWEQSLFHLYNRVRDAGHHMLVAGNAAPAALGITLPDLVSRLGWGPVFQIHPLSDEEKSQALRMRAEQRGMDLSEEVTDYLLNRVSRDMRDLFSLLDKLDEGSLAAQRRLTIPFVRNFIQ